jgi:hypothetical protein
MAENRKHMVTIALMTIIASKVHGGYIVSNHRFLVVMITTRKHD